MSVAEDELYQQFLIDQEDALKRPKRFNNIADATDEDLENSPNIAVRVETINRKQKRSLKLQGINFNPD